MVSLRCPRCGEVMEPVNAEMTCRRGRMGLSKVMLEALTEIVELPPSKPEPANIRYGGRWHCPKDGTRMQEMDGSIGCPECGRHLTRSVVYQLIELHPHRTIWTR